MQAGSWARAARRLATVAAMSVESEEMVLRKRSYKRVERRVEEQTTSECGEELGRQNGGTTSYIVNYGIAYEIWEALSKHFESTSTARILDLKSQLTNLRKEGTTINQYLFQFKDIADKFATVGEPLSYRYHLGYFSEGLGPEYDAFVTSIENIVDRPSIEDVHSLLLSHES
ncbi:hypothetical protein EZV62_007395 [Acer yangbiense]|uniref:Uncharacterized protein n=1 Tax=Acer yangbiense TaxID=1000413 RepID=A0A5C7I9Y1_9ROSI|nr:hypothetical protein EZV62_007395 [Acer yangbiense]